MDKWIWTNGHNNRVIRLKMLVGFWTINHTQAINFEKYKNFIYECIDNLKVSPHLKDHFKVAAFCICLFPEDYAAEPFVKTN